MGGGNREKRGEEVGKKSGSGEIGRGGGEREREREREREIKLYFSLVETLALGPTDISAVETKRETDKTD